MVRIAFLVAGCAYAGESGSLMQSHGADLGNSGDMSFRLSKLADLQLTTKRMEAEYKAMAQSIIKKEYDPKFGNTYGNPHNGNIWSTVEEQFDVLLWQLDEEKKTNDALVVTANNKVTACNDARNAAYAETGSGVDARLKGQNAARTAHSDCRGQEQTAIGERKDSCGRFVGQALCDAHQGKYSYFTKGQGTSENNMNVPDAVLHAVKEGKECRDELAHEVAKSSSCDDAQDKFELAFCQYDRKLTDTCDALDQCYETATNERGQVIAGVTELEKNQKVVYRMVQKVLCYVKTMKNNFKTLTNPMIDACEQEDHSGAADTRLTVLKPKEDPKAACDKKLLTWGAPGDSSWEEKEYSTMKNHHGNTYNGSAEVISTIEHIIDCASLLKR